MMMMMMMTMTICRARICPCCNSVLTELEKRISIFFLKSLMHSLSESHFLEQVGLQVFLTSVL